MNRVLRRNKDRRAASAMPVIVAVIAAFVVLGGYNLYRPHSSDAPIDETVPSPPQRNPNMSQATFGAGCFWGVEAAFRRVEGVTRTAVGYAGGTVEDVTYQQVCSGSTGHAEVVEVEFDPATVSYEALLDVFWDCHDPTQLNRQGPDTGTQYRSAIFYHDADQEAAARESMEQQQSSGDRKNPIVTQIVPAAKFWMAEEYHQQYLEKRGQENCRL